jgi:hypothetical protein
MNFTISRFLAAFNACVSRAHRLMLSTIILAIVTVSLAAWADEDECVHSKGYWKNHSMPVQSLTLGTVQYNVPQLLAILNAPVKGNGLVALSQQLIAAKLNAHIATVPPQAQAAINSSDALIGSRVAPPIGTDSLEPSMTSDLIETLDLYNTSQLPCQPLVDTDGDGLQDSEEVNIYRTDPTDADTDNDYLTDGNEVLIRGTNPLNADTDGDGATDGEEVLGLFPYGTNYFQTNPLTPDTDGDNYFEGSSDGGEGHDNYPLDPLWTG